MIDLDKSLQDFIHRQPITDTAHDLSHVRRVVNMARKLASIEGGDRQVLSAAAWLHDVVSLPKDAPNRSQASLLAADKALYVLKKLNFPEEKLPAVHHAILAHSHSARIEPKTLEAEILQDADRIDALGAVGIARCFLVGGRLNRAIYSVIDPLCEQRIPDDSAFCIDHFYKKLYQLPGTMNTLEGKREAEQRVSYMYQFIEQLMAEIQ